MNKNMTTSAILAASITFAAGCGSTTTSTCRDAQVAHRALNNAPFQKGNVKAELLDDIKEIAPSGCRINSLPPASNSTSTVDPNTAIVNGDYDKKKLKKISPSKPKAAVKAKVKKTFTAKRSAKR